MTLMTIKGIRVSNNTNSFLMIITNVYLQIYMNAATAYNK